MSVTRRRRPHADGFSTVEVLVGTVVALSALGTTVAFFDTQQKAIARHDVYSESQRVTRTTVDLFTRELRMAGYDPTGLALPATSESGCPGVTRGIVVAAPGRLRFRQDLNGDGRIRDPGEDVLYARVGERMVRWSRGSVTTLLEGLPPDGLRFRYFTDDDPPAELVGRRLAPTIRDCIARVHLRITRPAGPRPGHGATAAFTVATDVAIQSRTLLRH